MFYNIFNKYLLECESSGIGFLQRSSWKSIDVRLSPGLGGAVEGGGVAGVVEVHGGGRGDSNCQQ